LAIKFHPDRNPGDPEAEAQFILINKAQECLTDPKKKILCEKYGNPDGNKVPLKISIGLPSVLMKQENHVSVLVIFFVILLIIIPGVVLCWYSESEKVNKRGVKQENNRLYGTLLSENVLFNKIPPIIA
jgi:preprotein translocase subunit Sec63